MQSNEFTKYNCVWENWEELSLGKFHFLSVIFVMKKLSKIINSVFRKKYNRDDNISKGKELQIGYLAFKNIVSAIFHDAGMRLKFIRISKVLYFSRGWEWLIFKKQFYSNQD